MCYNERNITNELRFKVDTEVQLVVGKTKRIHFAYKKGLTKHSTCKRTSLYKVRKFTYVCVHEFAKAFDVHLEITEVLRKKAKSRLQGHTRSQPDRNTGR